MVVLKIAMTQSWVKRTATQDSAIQSSCWKNTHSMRIPSLPTGVA